ncbi:hypothetical protein D8B34_13940 [Verminephrobacter eiseniae]|uniref:hypothetical protein n=1 Tax=Verminephrobacter eiseniae TaxID=364317 RepID=UPI002237E40A|nr:hypothetical protein [Verminephrobacter eiseniae]MCW5230447.1 hypothetical protein [Verminephrobacter eiseniae]MCW5292180.1 hypothetical protein [Verminephrobacter eiseniae]MCW8184340.1 hypothetical protein [Verminephrobacter eiseniae]MCW8223148.1 hypothetical protein [Verminephrobacter eiseniae]MCW8234829.1 hypothetical protein [Verminephrobacter eiseniae]
MPLVSRHRSSVGLRWPSKRIAALHRLPIRSVLAARCALRCAPMAARSLRHLIGDTTLAFGPIKATPGDQNVSIYPAVSHPQRQDTHPQARARRSSRRDQPASMRACRHMQAKAICPILKQTR